MPGSTRRWPALCLPAVLALMLSACNGTSTPGTASNNVMPPVALGANVMTPDKLSPITTYPGAVFGETGMFHPKRGDTKAGGHGAKVDGIPCDTTEYLTDYHVHAYLGIVYNGQQVAIPSTIGLHDPGPAQSGYTATAGCYYFLHTHDESGIIHVEDIKNLPPSATLRYFGNVFDIWGVRLQSDSFAGLKGTVHAYVGNVPQLGDLTVSSYASFKVGDVRKLKIKSHEVLWLVIGKNIDARKLPPVTFYMEY